ncbi:helix-turn-helix domain protein [Burkholderia ambifaria AMMD]|uniref:Two component transcriptional regulator, AraC family n=1 Tax=Burkholderia ambifaria (strain ATCC BAA-244 / DSM 16087 / CCUG 44356 / LMG 19182 / AMMD) TaxID=339670 RepID=Q0B1R1_BURCM|nr:response regulator [Burkholderia ambifaria]ABI91912.1 two component transcriptional regulator, AraC family [Burkholderia ambifaria AMMD]AJY26735.1 helix-turn-helix domain protein [Burkholderia ambifaria AMMD]MBR7932554.1 response regulator [Burkholderia ambifaria]PEH70246.1 DNA-binding response regulator [Burkholderia ambifaria]QQC09315.1 response regulator [Burkholderia ambifaria]
MSPSTAALNNAHILIVDDQPDQLRLLIDILRGTGCRISIAFDGVQACERAQALAPDLILMDVRMPRMDGFTACRRLAADPLTSAIPVIFLTVAGDLHERVEGLEIGGVDYVVKPFEPAEVVARIRVQLARTKRPLPIDAPAVHDPFATGKDDDIIVRAAIRHLSRTLNDPPTVEQLARAVGTHEKRLSRAFRDNLGQTVFEYLRHERLRIAQDLLDTTSLSIASIAKEIGFSTPANFATAFRERFGITPTEWRRQRDAAGRDAAREPQRDA